MKQLILVPPPAFGGLLRELAPLIDEAARGSGGRYEAIDIIAAVTLGDWHLWCARRAGEPIDCIMLTRFLKYPRLYALELLAAIGDGFLEAVPLMSQVEAWAKARGCTLMQSVARPGWERVLRPHGYEKTHSFLEKPL